MTMSSYQATHVVPTGGLRAWASPDPAAAPVDVLDSGLDVQVVQRYGGWAQVQCSNGWTCWIDGDALQPIGGYTASYAAPAAARANASPIVAPFSILAGGLLVASTFLPWFSVSGIDLNAFKVPAEFLYSIDAGGSGDAQLNSIGGLVLLTGLVVGGCAFVRNQNARRIAGAVAGLLVLDYIVEVFRSLNDTPGSPGIFSVLGYGVYIAIVGAALAFADFKAAA